jgi:hypothetical protein
VASDLGREPCPHDLDEELRSERESIIIEIVMRIVQRGGVAITEEGKAAWDLAKELRKVFGSCEGLAVPDNFVLLEDMSGRFQCMSDAILIVHEGDEFSPILHRSLAAIARRGTF